MTDPTIRFRAPLAAELTDCAMIWHSSVDEYMTRLGHPLSPPVLEPAIRLSEHLLATDPERFRVAVKQGPRGERVVAFAIGLLREHVWFLSQLYVLPAEQGRGLGRALLGLVLPTDGEAEAPVRHGVLATVTDSAQPISNALYSKLGIVARMPVFNLVGRPNQSALPELPAGVLAIPLDAAGKLSHRNPAAPGKVELAETVDSIDRQVLGYAHRSDHDFLRVQGRTGFLFTTSSGEPLGYGYSSLVGRFGPVALLDETLTGPAIGHLMRAIQPRGAASVWVPGANDRAMVALLRAGLRLEGFPAMLCWSRPFATFERYLPAGLALL